MYNKTGHGNETYSNIKAAAEILNKYYLLSTISPIPRVWALGKVARQKLLLTKQIQA